MELIEAIKTRHSVRKYTDKAIEQEKRAELTSFVEDCNKKSGLSIQICFDEPTAFKGFMASYGMFSGVEHYIAVVGKKAAGFDEKAGYWGEHIVLKAAQLGLDTCWVAATYRKSNCPAKIAEDEKLYCVITLGYGVDHGSPHKSKSFDAVARVDGACPEWFKNGVEAALLAPTAINQQKFMFTLSGNTVYAKANVGPHARLDLGIVKYHFEIGAGDAGWRWG